MRLHEVASNEEIEELFHQYFSLIGFNTPDPNISIDDDGYISVLNGGCMLKASKSYITKKLPIKFDKVFRDFRCGNALLTTLEGCPNYVGGDFDCSFNQLTSLDHSPMIVKGTFDCMANLELLSLNGISKTINKFIVISYDNNLPLLKLLFVNKLEEVFIYNQDGSQMSDIQIILNKYLGQGRKGAIQCAAELTKAGYKGNARL